MKKCIAVILVIVLISISTVVLATPETSYDIFSGEVGGTIWFRGYGHLWGDDYHWYCLPIELYDVYRNDILAQGESTSYEDVVAVSNKGYGYNPLLIYVELPYVDLGIY